jgi:hypothetical protein
MRRYFITLIFTTLATVVHGQTYDALVDTALSMIKRDRSAYANSKPHYDQVIAILDTAVAMRPADPVGHYLLGCAYDYDNNPDGSSMDKENVAMSIKASEEFETVMRSAPRYAGEIISQDPYAKLCSVWGSIGFSYMVNGKQDSAVWAFKEGKRRGAFTDFALECHRQLLQSMGLGSVFFSLGDFSAMNTWYLQVVEHCRPDIIVLNLNMLQVPWYTTFYYKKYPSLFSSAAVATDTSLYSEWNITVREVEIGHTGRKMSWTMKPTQFEHYVYRQDLELLDIITNNRFIRELYFERGMPDETVLWLNGHMKDCVLAERLIPDEHPDKGDVYVQRMLHYPLSSVKTANANSDVELINVHLLRYAAISAVYDLMMKDRKDEARKLYQQLVVNIPESRFPYEDENIGSYIKTYGEELGGK